MKTKMILTAMSLLGLAGCGGTGWTTYSENRAGIRALTAKNPAEAQDHFTRALGESPFESRLHLNFGLALLDLKRPEEALKSFANADQLAQNDGEKFVARFDAGTVLGEAKQVDEALARYQQALAVNPSSVEAKTNIELLVQSQQGQGQGESKNQDQKQDSKQQKSGGQGDSKNDQKPKDPKDQKDPKDSKDKKDPKDDGKQGDKEKKQEPKEYQNSPKYKPRPFKGDLNESEVKKILGEIKNQEQRIRADYNRKDVKETPRDKDW